MNSRPNSLIANVFPDDHIFVILDHHCLNVKTVPRRVEIGRSRRSPTKMGTIPAIGHFVWRKIKETTNA
jgi:hypothetical protein